MWCSRVGCACLLFEYRKYYDRQKIKKSELTFESQAIFNTSFLQVFLQSFSVAKVQTSLHAGGKYANSAHAQDSLHAGCMRVDSLADNYLHFRSFINELCFPQLAFSTAQTYSRKTTGVTNDITNSCVSIKSVSEQRACKTVQLMKQVKLSSY